MVVVQARPDSNHFSERMSTSSRLRGRLRVMRLGHNRQRMRRNDILLQPAPSVTPVAWDWTPSSSATQIWGGRRQHPPLTEAEAEDYLATDLLTALNATLCYCPVLATECEERLAAIVDFTFNLGAGRLQTSTLRRRVNQRDWAEGARELRRWVHGGGRMLRKV